MDKHLDKCRILGLNVSYYRKSKEFSQVRLAEKLFISRNHLSRIEAPKGVKFFSADIIFESADILEIGVAKLFGKRE